jgi:Meiotically up-regulated gene 113
MSQAGYVYIVHGVGTNYIKVGKSTNLQKRLADLQNGVPFPLQLISAQLVYDADEVEATIKQRYASCLSRGEWFVLPDYLLGQWPIDAPVKSFFPMKEAPVTATPRNEAKAWLADYLRAGLMPTTSVLAAAAAVGISERTLRRAKDGLGVIATHIDRTWYWQLAKDSESYAREIYQS